MKRVGGGGRGEQEKRGLSLAFLSHFLSSSSYFLYFSSPLLSLSLGEILHLLLLFHSKTQTSPHTLTNGGRRGKIICCERERGRAGRRESGEKAATKVCSVTSSPSCSNLEAGFQAVSQTLLGMPTTVAHFVMNTHFLSRSCLPHPSHSPFSASLPSPYSSV